MKLSTKAKALWIEETMFGLREMARRLRDLDPDEQARRLQAMHLASYGARVTSREGFLRLIAVDIVERWLLKIREAPHDRRLDLLRLALEELGERVDPKFAQHAACAADVAYAVRANVAAMRVTAYLMVVAEACDVRRKKKVRLTAQVETVKRMIEAAQYRASK